ncbi:serine/threonine-protein kinase STY13-like [Triticum dicoccoides]|uniref:serine/threonine-protein kinase STY13-like n=1 Tax=Triticum dicoccoides TaxID=85692 RepID=UPI00188FAC10|nr:serine/threonine-protein kinase STY13-like [Triticum dicoccoides]
MAAEGEVSGTVDTADVMKMDEKEKTGTLDAAYVMKVDEKEKTVAVRSGFLGGGGGKEETYTRADMIDLENLDVEKQRESIAKTLALEKQRHKDKDQPMAPWEIDLAKLEVHHRIAPGTFGCVYRATYDGKDVLAKLLDWGDDGLMPETEIVIQREALRKEVVVWKDLDHPNVTKFIGASMGTIDLSIPPQSGECSAPPDFPESACCVVVEYLSGGTLRQHLYANRDNKLTYEEVVELALDLARGLAYLHSKDIVHRDVKAENMLLDAKGTLKIADFGVARVQAKNPGEMTGMTGTPGYMAPEVIIGKPYNRKCDVYSFGICLWAIYCCDMPYYPNKSFGEASFDIVHKNLRPKIPRCCPAPLANIMKKCWQADPEKRPDMLDVVQLLDALDTTHGGDMIPEGKTHGCFCFLRPRRAGP